MKIKYCPVKWNPYINNDVNANTEIIIKDENSIYIDDLLYEFDNDSIVWPDIYEQTNGVICDAYRNVDGELYITIRRFYTKQYPIWDTGDYHEISRQD